jgi:hypothetical protein
MRLVRRTDKDVAWQYYDWPCGNLVRGCQKKERNIANRNGEKNKGSGKRK